MERARDRDVDGRVLLTLRQRAVLARAEELCRHAEVLAAVAMAEQRTGELLRRRRQRLAPGEVHLQACLEDGTVVEARVQAGGVLCPPELRRRAELVVAAGDQVPSPDGHLVPATLEGPPMVVARTLVRASARVLRFDVGT